MNIQSILDSQLSSQLTGIGAVSGATGSSATSSTPSAGEAVTTNISSPAQFFSELQQLSQQDPSAFKAVASQLATTFQNAASQASGPDAKILTNLANQFSQAAQTGQLQPPQGGQGNAAPSGSAGGAHHHHHHHGGGGGSGGGAIQQAFQSAESVLEQALQGSSSSSPSASSTPPAATGT